jgi:Na+/glutamate symporter|tara:strand:+ start:7680 stop:8036 length:357 start_codon:yes stop_codon:yes gene_type:complete
MAEKNIGYGVFSTGLQAASTGASIGSVFSPVVGTAIGAGVGLIAGGLIGGLRANKQYKELKKIEKEQKQTERKMKDDAQAYGRRNYYQNIEPPMELDLEVNEPYVSSYDKFKQTTYGA